MTKKRNYGYYEALDLDWLNKHPDAPVMFKVKKQGLSFPMRLLIVVFSMMMLLGFFTVVGLILVYGG